MKTLQILSSIVVVLLVHTCSAKLVNAEVTISNTTAHELYRKPLKLRKNLRGFKPKPKEE